MQKKGTKMCRDGTNGIGWTKPKTESNLMQSNKTCGWRIVIIIITILHVANKQRQAAEDSRIDSMVSVVVVAGLVGNISMILVGVCKREGKNKRSQRLVIIIITTMNIVVEVGVSGHAEHNDECILTTIVVLGVSDGNG